MPPLATALSHLIHAVFALFLQLAGTERNNSVASSSKNYTINGFSALSNERTIELLGETFNHELEYLWDADSTPEHKTTARSSTEFLTPSKQLYNADYDEVNRTLLSMLAFKWVLANDYQSFTRYQPSAVVLKQESFNELRKLCLSQIKNPENILPLLVAMVINDLGKSPRLAKAVEKATGKPMTEANHDEVIYLAAENGMICCLQQLDETQIGDVLLGLKLGATLNIAQFAQAENVPGSLEGVKVLEGNKNAFILKFLEVLFDVAGAAGNVDARCAKAMIEPVYHSYMMAYRVLLGVVENCGSHRQNYDKLLIAHGEKLKQQGFRHLSVENPSERALLRLIVMGRSTSNKKQADLFDSAFKRLSDWERQALVDGLNVDGTDDGEAIIPYYMPAVISEGLKNTSSEPEGKIEALASVMRLLGRVYGGSKPRKGQPGVVKEQNLRHVTDVIHSGAFESDPRILDQLYNI
ncbi:hypothetical protein FRC18_010763 [Serendipita sp. 400]|nr:hypothetical protein FRC18_010763 [Serendipita sp. 400]